ncbi:MAG: hypothetical protein ACFFG0_47415 [Candidatus Thorarchaeota archaeon]
MKLVEPFIFRFKRECSSPKRIINPDKYIYDNNLQMLMTFENGTIIAVIDSKDNNGPTTKKCDIEKGEDQKDRRIWH